MDVTMCLLTAKECSTQPQPCCFSVSFWETLASYNDKKETKCTEQNPFLLISLIYDSLKWIVFYTVKNHGRRKKLDFWVSVLPILCSKSKFWTESIIFNSFFHKKENTQKWEKQLMSTKSMTLFLKDTVDLKSWALLYIFSGPFSCSKGIYNAKISIGCNEVYLWMKKWLEN